MGFLIPLMGLCVTELENQRVKGTMGREHIKQNPDFGLLDQIKKSKKSMQNLRWPLRVRTRKLNMKTRKIPNWGLSSKEWSNVDVERNSRSKDSWSRDESWQKHHKWNEMKGGEQEPWLNSGRDRFFHLPCLGNKYSVHGELPHRELPYPCSWLPSSSRVDVW